MDELDEFGIPIKKQTTKSKKDVDEFGIPIKKKASSEPTSEETAVASPTKPTKQGTSLATEVPTRAQVSVSLGGPTKLFPPKEEQHPTSIMWGNEPKQEGFIPPSTPIDIDQSIKYLEKTKSNPKELKRLKEVKAKMPKTPPVEYFLKKQIINNLTPAVEEANTITDEDKLQRDSEFEKDWNKTGFLNKAKQIGATILGETGNLLTEFLSFGKIKEPVTKEAMQIEPLEKYKNEVIKEATESKIKLSPEQFKLKVQEKFNNDWDTDKKAYNLSQLNYTLNDEEQKAIGENTFNKYKDLNENQKYFLNTASTLSKVRDNIGLELVNLDKQLSEKIKNGETPTESEIQSYNALSEKYKQYHSDAQNAYSKYSKNLDKVHSLETELDVFDNDNLRSLEFLKRLGIGVEHLGVGAIDFASYLANLHANTTPYSVATNSGNSELAIYLHKKANDLRDTIEQQNKGLRDTSNRFESVLSKSVDFVTENTPMVLGLTFGGAPAMFALAGTTAGEKYGEMLNENKDYNEFQKTIAPLLHGGAMLIPLSKQLKTIQNSGRVLLAGEKEFPSIVENVYKEKAANLFGKIKTFAGESFDLGNQLKLMEVLQEVNNGVVLGKDIDYKKLADLGVYETAPLLHGMNKVAPYLAGRVTEPFMSKEDYKIIDENTKQIFDLNKKLLSGELDANEADIVRQTIKDISAKSEEVVNNKLNRIGEYDKQTVNDILETTKKSSELREKANRVISSDKIDNNQKEVIIKNLRGEYSSIEQTKADLISGRTKNIVYVEKESDIPAEENRPKGVQYKVVENSVEKKLFEQQQAKPVEVKVEEQVAPVEAKPMEEVMSVKGISPENSSNYANLTENKNGDIVFFHLGGKDYDVIKKSTGKTLATSKEEAAALSRVGGLAMYYTKPFAEETAVKGDNLYSVTIPKEKVYDFNSDPDNLIKEARERFEKEHPGIAFSPNDQVAYVTKIAGEKGYEMVVAEWKGKTRAQTTTEFKPNDVQISEGSIVKKPFAEEYISNKDKGYKSIIPETKESKFAKVYDEINSYKNNLNKYDDLYHLKNNYFKYSQEEITKMIKESDLPQELKDKYNEALNYVEEQRRTEIPVFERTNDVVIKNAPEGNFLNIGLNIGTTDELLNKDDVVSMLPKGVKILDEEVREVVSEIDGKKNKEVTLLVKLSRQLTDAEMSKLLKDTQQKAIPQLTEGKGAMHGTKEWGDFNPEYFYLPKEGQLSEYKKPITAGKEVEYNGRKYFKNEAGNWVNAETNNEIKGIGEKGKTLITELDKLAAPTETYTEKTKKIADKIRSSELPDWMKANIEGGKKQGVDADALKEALAKAVEKTGELLDKGVELADAIKEAVNDIVGLLGEEKRASVEKDFENYYKSIEKPTIDVRSKLEEYKSKQKSLSQAIKSFIEDKDIKGVINEKQLKALIKKSSSVTTEKQFEKFIQYADNVINESNFLKEKSDLESSMKKAKKRKHGRFTKVVREFASIDVTSLSKENLEKYKEAINQLNQKMPNYEKMSEHYFDIMSEVDAKENEYSNIETFNQASDKFEEIKTQEVKTVDDYRKLSRNINSLKNKLNNLLADGTISQEDYKNIIDEIESSESKLGSKFSNEINDLKKNQINEINSVKLDTKGLTTQEKNLIERFKSLSSEDLSNLSVGELDSLNESLSRVKQGYVPMQRITDVVNKAEAKKFAPKIVEELDKADKTDVTKVKIVGNMKVSEAAFISRILGAKEGGAIDKYIINPIVRQLTQYRKDIALANKKILDAKRKAFGRIRLKSTELKSRNKIGMIFNMLQTFNGDAPPDFIIYSGNKKEITKYLSTIEESKRAGVEATINRRIDILNGNKSKYKMIKNEYNKLLQKYGNPDGTLNLEVVKKAFEDGTLFTAKEKIYLDSLNEISNDLETKQTAANEIQGKPFVRIENHSKRMVLGRDTDIEARTEAVKPAKRAGSGKERVDKFPNAIETDIEKIMLNSIEETNKDYYSLNAEKFANQVINETAREGKFSNNALNAIKENMQSRMNREFARSQTSVGSKLLAARMAASLVDPIRTTVEVVLAYTYTPLRAGNLKGYLTFFNPKARLVAHKLIEDTNSSLSLKNYSRQIESGAEVSSKNIFVRLGNRIMSFPEHATMDMAWMPNFESAFKEITGNDFSYDKYLKDASYRDNYKQAILDSATEADVAAKQIVGGGLKFEGREFIRVLPKFTEKIGLKPSVSADTYPGKIAGFFGTYTTRESKEFFDGFSKMYKGTKKGNIGEIGKGGGKVLATAIGAVGYGVGMALYNSIWTKLTSDDDKEKKKAQDVIDSYYTWDGWKKETGAQLAFLGTSRYGAVGRLATLMAISAAYNNTDDEKEKEQIRQFSKSQLFTEPLDYSGEYTTQAKNYKTISRFEPYLAYSAEKIFDVGEGVKGYWDLAKLVEEKGFNVLKEDEKQKFVAGELFLNSVNLMLMFKGTQVPMTPKIERLLKEAVKESENKQQMQNLKNKNPELYQRMMKLKERMKKKGD